MLSVAAADNVLQLAATNKYSRAVAFHDILPRGLYLGEMKDEGAKKGGTYRRGVS